MKLVKSCTPHAMRVPSENVFDQSICRTKEQNERAKSVMPLGAKNGKVSEEKMRKNLAVLTKTPRLKRFFPAKLLISNIETAWR